MSQSVNEPDERHERHAERWRLANNLLAGTEAMRQATEDYLPKNEAESDKAYKARLKRTFLYNVFENTVDTMAGKPFTKAITITQAPQAFHEHANNIDLQGRNITDFACDVAAQVIAKGISYIFVDHPAKPVDEGGNEKTLSRQDEADLQLRPYWVHVLPENLLEVRYSFEIGVLTIDLIRIREFVEEVDPKDPFKKVKVEQVRVVYPDRFEVWRQQGEKNEWAVFDEGVRSVNMITLAPVYAKFKAPFESKPPLQALMEKNLEHWQSSSDQNTLLHKARTFILFGKQLDLKNDDGTTKELTTDSLWQSDQDEGDLKVVEHSGAAISTGAEALKVTTDEMETLGGMLLQPDNTRTATESRSKDAKGDSRLHTIVGNIETAIIQAAQFHLDWLGSNEEVELSLFKEFSVFDPNFMSADDLLKTYMAGAITLDLYLDILKRRGVDFGEKTTEQIVEELQRQVLDIPRVEDAA